MSKKVLILSGSPRKGGNSDLLCDEFMRGAIDVGNTVAKVRVAEKKIAPCLGCYYCAKNGGKCVQPDDMAELLQKMIDADVLVLASPVYFYSICAQLKAVAEEIAKNLNTDTFELVPEKPYTSADLNWNDENSRVSSEHSDESKREVALVKSTPDNWEQYDTVYVGYPIWWGIAAWPVNGFVKANDFTGKTVIPFCTSASSGMGESGKQLSAMAGSGDWKEGKRFSSSATESEISDWLS